MPTIDYSDVTEQTGDQISVEAASMLVTRYEQASRIASGVDVLEVACGSGQGLGCLAARARKVVGGDCMNALLQVARSHYGGRIPLVQFDAHRLPFRDDAFDVVVFHEAIYYLSSPQEFIRECGRVLRRAGTLVMFTANREWPDFNPSPHSRWYPSAMELSQLLVGTFQRVEIYGAFPARAGGVSQKATSILKRAAVQMHLIPGTMKGKQLLKRVFIGPLVPVVPEVTPNLAPCAPLVGIDTREPCRDFKVLCAIASTGAPA